MRARAFLGTLWLSAAVIAGCGSGDGDGDTRPDTTAPRVVATDPPADAVGVAPDWPLSVTFSEPVDPASIDRSRFSLTAGGAPVPGVTGTSGRTVRFDPALLLSSSTEHTAVLSGLVTDRAGNPLGADVTWRFVTERDRWRETAVTSAPQERTGHTAVWTGREMIVWGGETSTQQLVNTGGRYDPVVDAWTQTPLVSAPSARRDHTAVWTGSEMIVWGGGTPLGGPTNTGGRYQPGSAAWSATAAAPGSQVPLPRRHHTAVWTGTEMIVWGGEIDGGLLTNTGARYRPDQWLATAQGPGSDAPSPRRFHTAVWTGEEMIVWGGESDGGVLTDSGATYRPDTNRWIPLPALNAPLARRDHTAVWTGTEMIVWGGTGALGPLQNGARFDPDSSVWIPLSADDAPTPRASHTAVWTGYGMIVWGGLDAVDGRSGARYRAAADLWRETTTVAAPPGRFDHTAVWTGSEMIVWGGRRSDTFQPTNTGGRYAP